MRRELISLALRKVSVDELEEFAGITEDEISNILKLAGEELPPEEK